MIRLKNCINITKKKLKKCKKLNKIKIKFQNGKDKVKDFVQDLKLHNQVVHKLFHKNKMIGFNVVVVEESSIKKQLKNIFQVVLKSLRKNDFKINKFIKNN
jgi:hypothetical protein